MAEKDVRKPESTQTDIHGVLLEINGFGVLILGPSGIGKSLNAAELISRGYKLVSDDVVQVDKTESGQLIGKAPSNIKNLMEIAGVGIINVKEIFGAESVLDQKKLDMVIELSECKLQGVYDRLGLEEENYKLLGVYLPYKLIPVVSEGNTSLIIEIAVRNQIAKVLRESDDTKNVYRLK